MVQSILLIVNLFFLEVFLSVDNAAILAILVKDLKKEDQPKALRYGIIGAFVFRGTSLFLISWLIHIVYLKLLAAFWLFYLLVMWLRGGDEEAVLKKPKSLLKAIILVEFMDIAFSLDNMFAATAMTSNIYMILGGVFLGIIAMRFVAGWFVKLMNQYPSLEISAYIVIGLLGARLFSDSFVEIFFKIKEEPPEFNIIFSLIIFIIFFSPIIFKRKKKA